jgi:catechol 2,3-dioxygenase-like lactoylglutathione lyase family enzyme
VFDHVTMRAADLEASARFYRTVLPTLGIEPSHVGSEMIQWADFSISRAAAVSAPTRHLHLGFVAPSRDEVDAFWHAGVRAGYQDDGAPGEREYTPDYYGSFLLDPDGNSAEAVHYGDVRRGGHIDHLWIRVDDLGRVARFYERIARHTGLRVGERWDQGRQFRGAWATFALISDGRPVTENLHLAFGAPDRQTVDDFHRAALAAGARDNGEPGERPRHGAGYYAAYVLDPAGANVESVYRGSGSA